MGGLLMLGLLGACRTTQEGAPREGAPREASLSVRSGASLP